MEIGLFGRYEEEGGTSLGPELIDQDDWFNAGYWSTFDVCWSGDGVKLNCAGTGFLHKLGFWVPNCLYLCVMGIVRSAGAVTSPYNGSTGAINRSLTGVYTNVYSSVPMRLSIYANTFTGNVYSLSIKQIIQS